MSFFQCRIALGVMATLFGCTMLCRAVDDEAGVEVLPNRLFIHKDSKTAFTVPTDWTIIAPYRLRKTTATTVLSLDKEKPRVTVTVVWSPIGNRPFSDYIRASSDADLGDEYATLVSVYGKAKVGPPTTMKVGPYTVFKVLIDDGPDQDGGYAGGMYLFEAGSGDNRWRVKIRAVYPLLNRGEYIRQVEEVVNQFVMEK